MKGYLCNSEWLGNLKTKSLMMIMRATNLQTKRTQSCDTNFRRTPRDLTLSPFSSLLELLNHLTCFALAHLLRDRVLDVVLTSENMNETLLLIRRRIVP